MTLTVKEKEHWKNRITRKIDQAVEAVLAAENPNFMEQVRRQAKRETLQSLGIAELNTEVETIEAEIEALRTRRATARRHILAVVRGVEVDDVGEDGYLELREVQNAIALRQELIEKQLLAQDELGRRILKLEREKEELLDTVWLATSPKQIKELWTTVSAVLDQEPTDLQKEALGFEPMEKNNV